MIETRVLLPEGKQRVSEFHRPSIHQISTLEKSKLCHRPILSSLLSSNFQHIAGGGLTRDLCHGQQRVSRSIMKGFIFFTHFIDCSVKTELIHRSNCAKKSCNRVIVNTIVDRQFSTAFAFLADLWIMDSWHGRLVSAFCECQHHIFCHVASCTLWTIITDKIPLYL